MILSLSALVRPQLECCVQCWAYQHKRRGCTGESPTKGHKNDEVTGESLIWELEPVSQEKRLRRDPITIYKYVEGRCEEDRGRLSVLSSDRAGGDGYKLKYRRFPLNVRKHFFMLRLTKSWHRLPREAVESPRRPSEAPWTWPWAPCSGWPCVSRGWACWAQSSLPASATLRFCELITVQQKSENIRAN